MKTIIITGTSRGIGAELALQLANEGHQVIALSRKENPDFAEIKNIHYLPVDLSDAVSIQSLNSLLKNISPTIDILIHNAGAIVNKPFGEITTMDFQFLYNVNAIGVALLNQIVLPMMKRGSHVLTISSMGGVQGTIKFPGLAAYSSSKAAAITLSELLAEEYKEQGISFNVLALGAVQTEMLEEAFPGYRAPIFPNEMASYIKDFALTGNKYFNGKTLQVSSTTP